MEEKKYCVYIHVNKVNGKMYVGQTCQKLQYRWRSGKGYVFRGSAFGNAIKKYGWDSFEHIVVKEGLSLEEANKLETELIYKYKTTSHQNGYNILYGGGNRKMPESVRKKLSESHKGITVGPCSEERKRKIGAANKGRHFSEESRKRMSEGQKGKKYSDEYKAKKADQVRRQWAAGIRTPNHAPSKHRKPVVSVNIATGEAMRHECITHAANLLKIRRTDISTVLSGKQKTAHGYLFYEEVV